MTGVSEITDTGAAAIPDVAEAKNTEADVADRAADVVDRAGNAIVELVNRAASNGEANLLAARETAEKLADQLRAAEGRINELEANVRYYQDRTERAEKWMHQISSEIHRSSCLCRTSCSFPRDPLRLNFCAQQPKSLKPYGAASYR